MAAHCPRSTTTSGSSTPPTTGPRPTTSPPSNPSKLHELQRLFLIEASKYNVLPLDDRRVERFNADLAGRPSWSGQLPDAVRRHGPAVARTPSLDIKNKSHAVTAQIDVPDGGAEGVIIAQGGAFGGWSLYAKEGGPAYCYNLLGLAAFKVDGDSRSRPASTRCDGVRLRRRRLGKGGTVTLYIDGDRSARGGWTPPSR